MSGRYPSGYQTGPCERTRSCQLKADHRGSCAVRICAHDGCTNPTRNLEERFCSRHEDRSTYERYEPGAPA